MSKIPFLDPAWLKAGLVDTSGDAGSSGQILSSTGSGVNWVDQADITVGETDKALSLTLRVKNTESVALTKGQVVCAAPSATPPSGNVIEVKLADNNGTNSMPAIGILNEGLDAAGGTNDEGEAIMFGRISGIDTSAFSVGDEVFVSDTAGALTATKPTGVKYIQKVGIITRDDASNGTIEIFGAGRTNDVPTPLYIDHANQRVGIGEEEPATKLDVSGNIRMTETAATSDTDKFVVLDSGVLKYRNGDQVISDLPTDNRYVAVAGDTMTGDLIVPNFWATGDAIIDGKIELGSTADSDFLTGDSKMSVDGYIMTKAIVNTDETGSGPAAIVFGDGSTFGNDRISLITAGNRRLFISTTGNVTVSEDLIVQGDVGIGTTSPDADLHVNSEDAAGTLIVSRGGSNLAATNNVGFITFPADYDGSPTNYAQIKAYANALSAVRGSLDFNVKSTSGNLLTGMTIYGTSNGTRVGIGTTSPSEKLEVIGNAILDASNANLKIKAGAAGTKGDIQWTFNTDSTVYASVGIDYDNRATDGFLIDSGYPITLDYASSYIRFSNNGSEKMRINSSGNVGIGTTNPAYLLDVNEDDNVVAFRVTGGGGGAAMASFVRDVGATGSQVNINAQSNFPQIQFVNTGNTFSIGGDTSGNFKISDNTAIGTNDRITIDNAGNVGIRTTDPLAEFHVQQASSGRTWAVHANTVAIFENNAGAYLQIITGNSNEGEIWFSDTAGQNRGRVRYEHANDKMEFWTAGAERAFIDSSGNLHADGAVVANSTSISDIRLKDNINTIDSALDKVKKLRGVEYTWNAGSRKDKKDLGVIAQEVEEVLPEIVHEHKMDFIDEQVYKTVDYEKITAVLIEAIKELNEKVKILEDKIQTLENQ